MKKTVILFAVLGGFLFLILGNIFKAGSGHVEVVEKVITLQEENDKLSQTNETLYTEVVQLRVVIDTLEVLNDSLLDFATEVTQKQNTNQINDEKVYTPTPFADGDQPYSFSVPIEIETEETEVSSSPN